MRPTYAPLLLCLAGCPAPVAIDTTGDSSGEPASSSSGAGTTTDASTTDLVPTTGAGATTGSSESTAVGESSESTAAAEPVCGDGIVNGDELCDDGTYEANDACDQACNPRAVVLWTQSWDSPAARDDVVAAIAIDGEGAIYLAGGVDDAAYNTDAWLRKLDSTGKELLSFSYAGAAGLDDAARTLALGEDGSIYLGGFEQRDETNEGAWVRKYDPTGKELWKYERTSQVIDGRSIVNTIALAGDALYIVGNETVIDKKTFQMFVQRLDADGIPVWTRTLPASASLYKYGLAITPEGDLLVGGGVFQEMDGTTVLQPWLGKYDADGALLWSRTNYLKGGGYIMAAAVGPAGELAVTGARIQFSDTNVWVASVDGSGDLIWEDYINGDYDDVAYALAFGPGGELYVGGILDVSGQAANTMVRRYTPGGLAFWTDKYNDVLGLSDYVLAVAVTPTMIVAAGSEFVLNHGDNQWIRAYAP